MNTGVVFTLIVAVIVIGILLVFGTGQMASMFCLSSDAQAGKVITELESEVDRMFDLAKGSSHSFMLNLPGDAEFCFVNSADPASVGWQPEWMNWQSDPVYAAVISENSYNLWYTHCSGQSGHRIPGLGVTDSFCAPPGTEIELRNEGTYVSASIPGAVKTLIAPAPPPPAVPQCSDGAVECLNSTHYRTCQAGRWQATATNMWETCQAGSISSCADSLSCSRYLVYVPVGDWPSQESFEGTAANTANFFLGISRIRASDMGMIYVPLDYCDLPEEGSLSEYSFSLQMKRCADRYTSSLGIGYERVVGLSPDFVTDRLGYSFMSSTMAFAHRGLRSIRNIETPETVAHELGHTYGLCDEYLYEFYSEQDRYSCENPWPAICSTADEENTCVGIQGRCCGNPSFRDYSGPEVKGNICQGTEHYTVMGGAGPRVCGYDREGYYAVE
jgi:hypothetical protein